MAIHQLGTSACQLGPSAAIKALGAASSTPTQPPAAAVARPPPTVTSSQLPPTAQCSPSAAPALALAGTAGFVQTYPGKAAAIPLDCAIGSLTAVKTALFDAGISSS